MNLPDLVATRDAIRHGRSHAAAVLEASIQRAQAADCAPAFVHTHFAAARVAVQQAPAHSELAGLAVSVKDLFDEAGEVTRAGSRVLADQPPARTDAPAVARLREAGGVVLGRSHMVEFAFSGVGWNPHFSTPANPCDTQTARIPGGSSSGAAVSVASGAAFIGLGSDTGGSIRIPAALCGVVGFKSTARLVPTAGAVPLSTTLDTVCAVTRSVRDAIVAHEILARRRVTRSPAPLSGYRLAVARTSMLDELEPAVAQAFEASLHALRGAGAVIEELALNQISELAHIQSTGGFSAAESHAWHRPWLAQRRALYDPRVAQRIERGQRMSACDYIDLLHARQRWIAQVQAQLRGFDAVLSPTVPITAVALASIADNDAEFFRVNALLLRNTSVVNMLDGCALSLPCQAPGHLPVGLMLWHAALHDDTVLNLAVLTEQALAQAGLGRVATQDSA